MWQLQEVQEVLHESCKKDEMKFLDAVTIFLSGALLCLGFLSGYSYITGIPIASIFAILCLTIAVCLTTFIFVSSKLQIRAIKTANNFEESEEPRKRTIVKYDD